MKLERAKGSYRCRYGCCRDMGKNDEKRIYRRVIRHRDKARLRKETEG